MSVRNRRLLTRLIEHTKRQAVNKPARMLFVHCMHGLGNRLRAFGSAMSFANATNCELVIIWEKDAHIAATFEDLFADELNIMPFMDFDNSCCEREIKSQWKDGSQNDSNPAEAS